MVLGLGLTLTLTATAQTVQVRPTVETDPVPSRGDAADDPCVWIHPTDPALSTIIGTDKKAGLAVYDMAGHQLQYLPDMQPNNVDIRYNFPLGEKRVALVGLSDRINNTLRFFQVDPQTRMLQSASRGIRMGIDVYGFCLYHSPHSGKYYAFVSAKNGTIQQWELFDNGTGAVDATEVRNFDVGSQTEGCVADDEYAVLYLAEENKGIWKYGAELETGTARTLVDKTGQQGHLKADVEGLSLYYASDGTGYLIASSQGADKFVVYRREGSNEYVMTFKVVAGNGLDAVSVTDGLDVLNFPLGPAFPFGAFIAQDGNNAPGNQNFKLVPWEAIANKTTPALTIDPTWDPRAIGAAQDPPPAQVKPTVETEPVVSRGDAANDPCIWMHPTDPALSTIIGTDKKAGLAVYDLAGYQLQYITDIRPNSVDIRYNFPLGKQQVALVGISNRSSDTLRFYDVDPQTRLLQNASPAIKTGVDVYGFCLYHSPHSGYYYAFVTSENGAVQQWELSSTSSGRVKATLVRSFSVDSEAEGCVADDEYAVLYLAEKTRGIWKYAAEPTVEATRTLVDMTGWQGHLLGDVEGLTLYYASDGTGYLIASDQGADKFVVYRREGNNDYIMSFKTRSNKNIDSVRGTEGIDLVNVPLGPTFPFGVFVAQDNNNTPEHQNFKLVPWETIAQKATHALTTDQTWDPRAVGAEGSTD
jgi:3-phytase